MMGPCIDTLPNIREMMTFATNTTTIISEMTGRASLTPPNNLLTATFDK